MGELPIARVDLPDAQRLADLGSILQDLTFTVGACKRLLRSWIREPGDCQLAASYGVRAVPSLVVDGNVVLVGRPSSSELESLSTQLAPRLDVLRHSG